MGVLRMATRATRTGVRATRSVAHGRVPSLGVRVGVGGFGVGVGTRGVSVRTPVLSQSVGLSGFTTTLKVPGVARLSVNPVRPSATLGVGPLRLRASRNPGIGLSTGLVSLGVTTKPLAWIDVLGFRVALPGQLPPRSRPWHEEVDDQWRPYYERRPPSISEQLYDLIQQVEDDGVSIGFSSATPPTRPTAATLDLTYSEIREHRRTLRRDARKSTPFRARQQRREALQAADAAHDKWIEEERLEREADRDERQRLIDRAFDAWQSGDPIACVLIANSILSVAGLPGFLVYGNEGIFTLVVLAPDIDVVHPYGPSVTPSGNPTVKKRPKAARESVHADLVGAATIGVIRSLSACLPRDSVLHVAVTLPSGSLANAPTVAWFDHRMSDQLPSSESHFGSWIVDRASKRSNALADLLPDSVEGDNSAPAVALDLSSDQQLSTEVFWIELDAVMQEIRSAERPKSVHRPSESRSKSPSRPRESRPSRRSSSEEHDAAERVEVERHRADMDVRRQLADLESQGRANVDAGDISGIDRIVDALIAMIPSLTGDGGYDLASAISELNNGIVGAGRRDLLERLEISIALCPDDIRQPIASQLEATRGDLEIADRILHVVASDPGCRQADLPRAMSLDAFRVRTICWYLNHFGRLDRAKSGNSYSLSIPE